MARNSSLNCPHGIDLLLACRQIYSEACSILYGGNELHVNDPWDFIAFSRAIRPETLSIVTQLDIQWGLLDCVVPGYTRSLPFVRDKRRKCPDENYKLWERLWDIIARQMPGLLDLNASWEASIYRPEIWSMEWIKPMMNVRGLRSCKIEVRHIENDEDWGQSLEGFNNDPHPVTLFERDLEKHMCGDDDDHDDMEVSYRELLDTHRSTLRGMDLLYGHRPH
ncbi:MAG: hypothetical protein M1836_003332 [Candelina mexicana]|nr:MAG: hypothetical protein M1836_003332 [Candelina mexicana]